MYNGKVPCCGIFCGSCPKYTRDKNICFGAENNCEKRKCGIYECCIEKKKHVFCFQCKTFPCNKFKRFAETWKNLGQNLYENQKIIKEYGAEGFLSNATVSAPTKP